MASADVRYRPARRDETRRIAELYSIASDGVADYVWSRIAQPGEDILDVGARRYAREDTEFSYRNCTVAEYDDRVAGMMVAYRMETFPGRDAEPDPVLKPFAILEHPESYYICGLALYPEFSNRGIGSGFIEIAQQHARATDLRQLSLIVFERNAGAVRLYQRNGFVEIARQPIVPHALIRGTGEALLMVKDL